MKRGEQTGIPDKYVLDGLAVKDGGKTVATGADASAAKKTCNALNLQHRLHRGCMECKAKGEVCYRCNRRPVLHDFYSREARR